MLFYLCTFKPNPRSTCFSSIQILIFPSLSLISFFSSLCYSSIVCHLYSLFPFVLPHAALETALPSRSTCRHSLPPSPPHTPALTNTKGVSLGWSSNQKPQPHSLLVERGYCVGRYFHKHSRSNGSDNVECKREQEVQQERNQPQQHLECLEQWP